MLEDLNMEKGFEIERIKKTEIKLEKLKISKTIVDSIRKPAISKKCYHALLGFYLCQSRIHNIIDLIMYD